MRFLSLHWELSQQTSPHSYSSWAPQRQKQWHGGLSAQQQLGLAVETLRHDATCRVFIWCVAEYFTVLPVTIVASCHSSAFTSWRWRGFFKNIVYCREQFCLCKLFHFLNTLEAAKELHNYTPRMKTTRRFICSVACRAAILISVTQ